jgi:hypothetical protein
VRRSQGRLPEFGIALRSGEPFHAGDDGVELALFASILSPAPLQLTEQPGKRSRLQLPDLFVNFVGL